eukprot:3919864-Amphidinium_carterae.1
MWHSPSQGRPVNLNRRKRSPSQTQDHSGPGRTWQAPAGTVGLVGSTTSAAEQSALKLQANVHMAMQSVYRHIDPVPIEAR